MADDEEVLKRNRPVHAITSPEVELKGIFAFSWYQTKTSSFQDEIETVFQKGRNSSNIDFKNNGCDTGELFLKGHGGDITTFDDTYRFRKPNSE